MNEQPNIDQRADELQKLEFARLLFEAGPTADSYNIGFQMFPANANRAVLAGGHWRADPIVISELARLRTEQVQVAETLPTQTDLARSIWIKMQDCTDPDAYVKLAKLYAEVQGMIKKPTDANNANTPRRPVMLVRDHGSDAEWEMKMSANQNRLQEEGEKEIRGSRVDG